LKNEYSANQKMVGLVAGFVDFMSLHKTNRCNLFFAAISLQARNKNSKMKELNAKKVRESQNLCMKTWRRRHFLGNFRGNFAALSRIVFMTFLEKKKG